MSIAIYLVFTVKWIHVKSSWSVLWKSRSVWIILRSSMMIHDDQRVQTLFFSVSKQGISCGKREVRGVAEAEMLSKWWDSIGGVICIWNDGNYIWMTRASKWPTRNARLRDRYLYLREIICATDEVSPSLKSQSGAEIKELGFLSSQKN